MNTDGSYYTAQLYSNVFELTAANGSWAILQEGRGGRFGATMAHPALVSRVFRTVRTHTKESQTPRPMTNASIPVQA